MKRFGRLAFLSVLVANAFAGPVHANLRGQAKLAGAWAGSGAQCEDTFVKTKKGLAFKHRYGSHGAIFQGNKVIVPQANCTILKSQRSGKTITLSLSCATMVASSDNRTVIRLKDENSFTRVFSAVPGMETHYERCRF